MALDLDSLEELQINTGEPLEIDINLIEEDPDQPRTIFDNEELEKLINSIKINGLITPISVRKHPTKKGCYILNNGARRFKAHQALGKKKIKAYVDNHHNDYQQVADNLIRDNFKPLELALFIQKKLNEGEKKKDIAEKMGLTPSMITTYLTMLDMPDCVKYIYDQGQTSPKIIYDLTKAYENYPQEIEDWVTSLNDIEDVTVKSVREFIKNLKNSVLSISEDEIEEETIEQEEIIEDEKQQETTEKPIKLKPVILVNFNQENYILVNKKTNEADTLLIKQFIDSEEIEVKASKCKLIGTSEI